MEDSLNLIDDHGRKVRKLRVSLTDKCNLRCHYCMPVDQQFMDESKYRACAICGLSEYPQRFDQQFQTESVKYIPKFLAAAIVGENPSEFGLTTKPLSSY